MTNLKILYFHVYGQLSMYLDRRNVFFFLIKVVLISKIWQLFDVIMDSITFWINSGLADFAF